MHIALTGASGHIGYHVARLLLERGHDVRLLLRGPNVLTRRLERLGARVHTADLLAPETYLPALAGVEALFHLAAVNTTSQAGADLVERATVGLTKSLLEAARRAGVATVVYTSSVVVLGRSPDPARLRAEEDATASAESPYVRGKVAAERAAREAQAAGADVRIVYPSWVVGPDDPRLTPPHRLILQAVEKGQRFSFAGGISIAHVAEVAEGHVAAWEKGRPQGRYVLGGENVTFARFHALLARFSGQPPPSLTLPKAGMLAAATALKIACGLLDREAPVDPAYVRAIVGNFSWYDSSRARAELGYRIRPVEETLQEAVQLARQRLAGTYSLNLATRDVPATPPATGGGGGRLLITGVPGWLGNRFVDVLSNGDRAGRRYPPRPVRLFVHPACRGTLDLPAGFEVKYGDLNDPAAVQTALEGVETVFHLAGAIYPPKVATLYRVNVDGTRNLVDACIERGVRRLLYMSTDSVCGHGTAAQRRFDEHTPARPYGNYGRSKWMAEEYVLEKTRAGEIDGTSLRGFWFFGPHAPARQLTFARMFARWPRQVVFGDGQNLRSISHVDNIVQAFLAAETQPATHGKWYWIGDGDGGYTVDALYAKLAGAFHRRYRPVYVPKPALRLLGVVDTFLTQVLGRIQPTIHAAVKFPYDIAGRSDAAARDFGYDARGVGLEEAAAELAREYSERV